MKGITGNNNVKPASIRPVRVPLQVLSVWMSKTRKFFFSQDHNQVFVHSELDLWIWTKPLHYVWRANNV
jgi:hypothetical protein